MPASRVRGDDADPLLTDVFVGLFAASEEETAARLAALLPRLPGHQPWARLHLGVLALAARGERCGVAAAGRYGCAWAGRLDGIRDDFVAGGLLPTTAGDAEAHPGSARRRGGPLLAALARFGETTPEMIHGPLAWVGWDPDRRRLLLTRDRLGTEPLYFAETGDGFWFSTRPDPLLLVPGVDRAPDEVRAALFLCDRFDVSGRSFLRGIGSVPPGHFMVVDGGAGPRPRSSSARRYWCPPAPQRPAPRRRDAAAEFGDLVLRGVRRSLDGATAGTSFCFLSGGVDSGLVTAAAATALCGRTAGTPPHEEGVGGADPVDSIADPGRLIACFLDTPLAGDDESPYAEALCAAYGVYLRRIPLRDPRPLAGLPELYAELVEPTRNAMYPMELGVLDAMRNAGRGVGLHGLFGDGLCRPAPLGYLLDLLLGGRWLRLLRVARWTPAGRAYLGAQLRRTPGPWRRWPRFAVPGVPGWVRPDVARRTELEERLATSPVARRSGDTHWSETAEAFTDGLVAEVTAEERRLAERRGVRLAFPLLDESLVEWACRTPAEVKLDRAGRDRAPYRLQRSIPLPTVLRQRTSKTSYAAVAAAPLRNAERPHLQRLLADGAHPVWSLCDRNGVRKLAEAHTNASASRAGPLFRICSLAAWMECHG